MNRRIRLLFAIALACGWCARPVAAGWRQEIDFDGLATTDHDEAFAAAVTPGGDLASAGYLTSMGMSATDFFVALQAGADGSEIWRLRIDDGTAYAVAADASGDVVAAGEFVDSGVTKFAVAKMDGTTGAEQWRAFGNATGFGVAMSVTVDASGDVIAGGFTASAGVQKLTVVKLQATDGMELWRFEEAPAMFYAAEARSVIVDASGDVYASGILPLGPPDDMLVLKLDGTDGSEIWRSSVGMYGDRGTRLPIALDGAGGIVIATDAFDLLDSGAQFSIVKLDTSSGAELWRYEPPDSSDSGDAAASVAIDASGDVFAGGYLKYYPFVARLSGLTGLPVWERRVGGHIGVSNGFGVNSLAVDSAGDVVGAGDSQGGPTDLDFYVFKLDGATGRDRWRRRMDSTTAHTGAVELAWAVGLDAADNVFAVGQWTSSDGVSLDWYYATTRLDGSDGNAGGLKGKKLIVKDHAADASKRRILGLMKDTSAAGAPPGSAGDPILGGAKLLLRNPITSESASFTLPGGSTFWHGTGNPAGTTGWRYSDPDGTNGPCSLLLAKPGKLVKFLCKGTLGTIPFTLDEAMQGELEISVQLGSAAPQCAVFGDPLFGGFVLEGGTSNPGPAGKYIGRNSRPVLGLCPAP